MEQEHCLLCQLSQERHRDILGFLKLELHKAQSFQKVFFIVLLSDYIVMISCLTRIDNMKIWHTFEKGDCVRNIANSKTVGNDRA